MSCYMVSKETIDYIVAASGVEHVAFPEGIRTAGEMGSLLILTNAMSVSERYGETLDTVLAGHEGYRYEDVPHVDRWQALKCVHCLNYQSCDSAGWDRQETCRFLVRLEDALCDALGVHRMLSGRYASVTNAPQYENAAWGL